MEEYFRKFTAKITKNNFQLLIKHKAIHKKQRAHHIFLSRYNSSGGKRGLLSTIVAPTISSQFLGAEFRNIR